MSNQSLYEKENAQIINTNVQSVRKMIERKNSPHPYLPTRGSVHNVITDMDHFPYTRFFRGVSYFPDPIVFEREAGWRNTHNNCYSPSCPPSNLPYPNHCYEAACSVVYPCHPQFRNRFADIDTLAVQLNDACLTQYR